MTFRSLLSYFPRQLIVSSLVASMAWRCSGRTNAELIANMLRNEIFTSQRVGDAMAKVDRANYVLADDRSIAYTDSPQSIGYEATISAPHMHAHAIENLLPLIKPGSRVLDVGSGSGYLVAVLHHLVESDNPNGIVVGIEHIPELVDWSVENIKRDGLSRALEDERIIMVVGDGRKGYESKGPFDAIHVGAAAPKMPQALIEQLARPGRMFIPIGTYSQVIIQVDKDANGNVTQKELMGVRYVPLTDRPTRYD